MSKGAIITLVVLVLAVLGGAIGMKMQRQSAASRDARQSAVALLQSSPTYRSNQEYVDRLIDEHHGAAFESAYQSGGLASQADFDEEIYLTELWRRMAESAQRDNRKDVVQIIPTHATEKSPIQGMRKPTG